MVQTVMERHGYKDPDLYDKTHDQAVIDISRSALGSKLLNRVFGSDEYAIEGFKGATEYVYTARYGPPIAYVDVRLTCQGLRLKCEACRSWYKELARICNGAEDLYKSDPEYKEKARRAEEHKAARPCHDDLLVYRSGGVLIVEVKSRIPTYGVLMRQMNSYRAIEDDRTKFAVYFANGVCEYADAIREQGIYCFHAREPRTVLKEMEAFDDMGMFD